MPTTCQTIITRALSKLGIATAGVTPRTADNDLGLQALKGVLHNLITSGTFGTLTDVIPAVTSYEAGENERVVNDGTITVTLPDSVPLYYTQGDYGMVSYNSDESSIRPPRHMSVIEEVNTSTGAITTNIYDAQLRAWVDINALAVGDDCPLALRDENGLAALLAIHVADEFGQQPTNLTLKAAFAYKAGLAHNWSEAGEVVSADKSKYY